MRQNNPRLGLRLTMSTPTPRKVFCGTVAVRPADEVRAELERACRKDRKTLATPIPRPASGTPSRFSIVKRPPLPAPPLSHQQADVGPASSDAERRITVAGIAAAVGRDSEATIRPLLGIAATAAPTTSWSVAPGEDDHHDLRRWRRWSMKWDE